MFAKVDNPIKDRIAYQVTALVRVVVDKLIKDRAAYQVTVLGRVVADKRQAIGSAFVVAEVGTCQVIQVDRRPVDTGHKREKAFVSMAVS